MKHISFSCDQSKLDVNQIRVTPIMPKAKSSKDELITFFWNVIKRKDKTKFPFVALKVSLKKFSIQELYILKSEVQDRVNRDQNYGAYFWSMVKSKKEKVITQGEVK